MDPRREFMQAQYRTGRLVAFSVTMIVPVLGFVVWIIHFPRMSRWERLIDAEEARLSGVPRIIRG